MTNKNYILALDEGTTGCTAIVFNTHGHCVGKGYKEITQYFPKTGWVEHDAMELYQNSVDACKEAMSMAGIGAQDLSGMGITNQRETTVLWDKRTLQPVSKAIVWQCKRTVDACSQLKTAGLENAIHEKTGLLIDPYFSATKIQWILEHIPLAKILLEKNQLAFGTVDSWLIAKLTQQTEHVTDYTNASRTLCFNIHEKRWDDDLLNIFGLPKKIFPHVQSSSSHFGDVHPSVFGNSIPILAVAGDQQASLFGHGCTESGTAKCTYGTGAFALAVASDPAPKASHGLLLTLACDKKGLPVYAFEGSIFMAGAVIQWLRDQLQIIERASQTQDLAFSIEDNGGVFLVPAFSGLGTPHWNPMAQAAFFGMTRGTTKAHLARAALESISYQTVDLVDSFIECLRTPVSKLHIDGGMVANSFFTQFTSDILDTPLVRPPMEEMTVFGAAKLCSIHPSLENRFHFSSDEIERVEPNMQSQQRKLLLSSWRRAVKGVIDFAAKK